MGGRRRVTQLPYQKASHHVAQIHAMRWAHGVSRDAELREPYINSRFTNVPRHPIVAMTHRHPRLGSEARFCRRPGFWCAGAEVPGRRRNAYPSRRNPPRLWGAGRTIDGWRDEQADHVAQAGPMECAVDEDPDFQQWGPHTERLAIRSPWRQQGPVRRTRKKVSAL